MFSPFRPIALALCFLAIGTIAGRVNAADEALVGALALAADNAVAAQLKLSDDQRAKLNELFDARDRAALAITREIRALPDAERQQKMEAFALESETLGAQILGEPIMNQLRQMKIAKGGMRTIVNPKIAEKLALSAEQVAQAQVIVNELDALPGDSTDQARRIAKAEAERKLAGLLSREQRGAWEQLTGAAGDAPAGNSPMPPGPMPPGPGRFGPGRGFGNRQPGEGRGFGGPGEGRGPAPGGAPAGGERVQFEPEPGEVRNADGELPFRFKFRYTPWKDVIELFAYRADLSLQMEVPPPGTCNYSDNKSYTPSQAIDLLNHLLQVKGYTLLRKEKMLIVWNLEDGTPPPTLITTCDSKDLARFGEYELVSVLFTLNKMTAEEAEVEVRKVISPPPMGNVISLSKSRQLQVTDVASKARRVKAVLEAIENPPEDRQDKDEMVAVENSTPEALIPLIRTVMGIPEGFFATPDGSLKITILKEVRKFYVIGKKDSIDKFKRVVKTLDSPENLVEGASEQPQLEVYQVQGVDPDALLAVLKGLLPEVANFLMKDPATGNIIANVKPHQHRTIKATIEQMQSDDRTVEVIKLRRIDPESARIQINNLFGGTGGEPSKHGPKVDVDENTSSLIVKSTPAQLTKIRDLLRKLGESEEREEDLNPERSPIRQFKLSGRSARSALEQIQAIWPTLRGNNVRIVDTSRNDEPATSIPALPEQRARKSSSTSGQDGSRPESGDFRDRGDFGRGGWPGSWPGSGSWPSRGDWPPRGEWPPRGDGSRDGSRGDGAPRGDGPPRSDAPRTPGFGPTPSPTPAVPSRTQLKTPTNRVARVALKATGNVKSWQWVVKDDSPATEEKPDDAEAKPAPAKERAPQDGENPPAPKALTEPKPLRQPAEPEAPIEEEMGPSGLGDEIVVTIGPAGVIITSQDLDALDQFESLLNSIISQTNASGREYNVFYLKHSKADVASVLLQEALSGAGAATEGSGGGNLMSGIASNMFGGGFAGDLMGNLMGGGGGSSSSATSASIKIIPDGRLNALIVQAKPTEIDLIEQLLKIIDRPKGPEAPQVQPSPRFIYLKHASAEEVATQVRQVYATRMASDPNVQRQPSPQELIQALRGGAGGRGGGGGRGGDQSKSEEPKMTIAVDKKSNALIVSATDYTFQEVQNLVRTLDIASANSDDSTTVVPMKITNADAMVKALKAILGDAAVVNRQSAQNSQSNQGRQGNQGQPGGFPQGGFPGMQGGRGGMPGIPGMQGGFGFPGMGGGGGGGRGGGGRGGGPPF